MMDTLALTDLRYVDGEPRVQDLRLAEALGMQNPYNIRRTIRRNLNELRRYGEVFSMMEKTSPKGGRPGTEYYLTEGQALLICMFSETERAADVRQALIQVFMAWRQAREGGPAGVSPVDMVTILTRLTGIEGYLMRLGERRPEPPRPAADPYRATLSATDRRLLGHHRAVMPGFRHDDPEVRAHFIATHRAGSIRAVRDAAIEIFGAARIPAERHISRFWRALDVAGVPKPRSRKRPPGLRLVPEGGSHA